MTIADLKSIPGFIEWADEGENRGFLRALGDCVDTELGASGLYEQFPHWSHQKLGVQMTLRQTRNRLADPLGRRTGVEGEPVKRYSGLIDTEEPEWK